MTEPNATPAPLTSERCSKRVPMAGVWFRDAQCSRKAVGMFDGAPLCRQHSPAAKAARDAKYEAKFKARLARDMAPTVRLSEALAELDATRAKLADTTEDRDSLKVLLREAESSVERLGAKLAEAEALAEGTLRDVVIANTKLTAAESRVAALTEALRECEEWFDGRADVDDGPDGQPVPNSAMRMQQLCAIALSPSQDAKDGGAV